MRLSENKNIKIISKQNINDAEIVKVRIDLKGMGDDTTFRVYSENGDSFSILSSLCLNRFVVPSWKPDLKFYSRANQDMPIVEFINKQGQNVCFFALTNTALPLKIQPGIEESTGNIEIVIEIQKRELPKCDILETDIYLDNSKIPYYEALNNFNDYIDVDCPKPPLDARKRTYSTWYSFQRDINADSLTKQFLLAKECGMNNVIIDDGWETEVIDNNVGQAYIRCGDWEVYKNKFSDFRGFVDNLHSNGIKVMLWFGTPFIGKDSKIFAQFKNKFLKSVIGDSLMMPDPRYKEIRDWYVNLFSDRLVKFNLDGLKLDFIDDFELADNSCEFNEGMDIPVLGQAVAKLVNDISNKLREIKNDVLIEYRQKYIGPLMQKNCNIFRVQDCSYGAFYNRINGITLRLFCPKNVVQTDMIMWDKKASPEAVADQLSASIFLVPQISMKLDEISEKHKKVLKYYLDFIDENMDVLQFGKLVPLHPESYYPVCYASKGNKMISVLYEMNSFKIDENINDFVLINASGDNDIFVEINKKLLNKKYFITDCMGEIKEKGVITNKLNSFEIPHNGFLYINR